MAIVSGSFVTLLHPGLKKTWAGTSFQKQGNLWVPPVPSLIQSQSVAMLVIDDIYSSFGPQPEDFDEWDDYLIAQAEWQYDAQCWGL